MQFQYSNVVKLEDFLQHIFVATRSKHVLRLTESGPRNDRRRRKNEYKSRRLPYMATDPPLIFRCQSCATSPLYRFPQNHHHPTALFLIASGDGTNDGLQAQGFGLSCAQGA